MEDKVHLEWIDGKTRITIEFTKNTIDIKLYYTYPLNPNKSTPPRINLSINKDALDDSFEIGDLQGNGFESEVQDKGFGKLIVNVAIQAIRYYLKEIKGYSLEEKRAQVFGETSTAGDDPEEPGATECWQRRNGFWQSFGFVFNDPNVPISKFRCPLDQLNFNDNGETANGTPTYIDIREFWLIDEKPTLSQPDKSALSKIDVSLIDTSILPNESHIKTLDNKIDSLRTVLFWFLLILIFIPCCFAAMYFEKYSLLIFAFFIAWFISLMVSQKIISKRPEQKQLDLLRDKRNQAIDTLKKRINCIEAPMNGFLWRLMPFLRGIIPPEEIPRLEQVSNQSREQVIDIDNLQDYCHFIKTAKSHIK